MPSQGPTNISLKKDEFLFFKGDTKNCLYLITSGRFMVFINKGSVITPLAYLGKDEYIGEMAFFDKKPRSAHVISMTNSQVLEIPSLDKQVPNLRWPFSLANSLTLKIRYYNELMSKHSKLGSKEQNLPTLSPQEQGHYFHLLMKYAPDKLN